MCPQSPVRFNDQTGVFSLLHHYILVVCSIYPKKDILHNPMVYRNRFAFCGYPIRAFENGGGGGREYHTVTAVSYGNRRSVESLG